ncbi:MAG: hypothetical protein EA397_13600 [Deltaproteobacteria bacterium]|nr:MAG: hypothetical protein EA397_13600 [Deltaproteobacteria bacterium]
MVHLSPHPKLVAPEPQRAEQGEHQDDPGLQPEQSTAPQEQDRRQDQVQAQVEDHATLHGREG